MTRHHRVLAVAVALIAAMALAAPAQAEFGFSSFDTTYTNADSSTATQAGAHPYAQTTGFVVNTKTVAPYGEIADGPLKDQVLDQIVGLAGNPNVVPACAAADFSKTKRAQVCPSDSQIGIGYIHLGTVDTAPIKTKIVLLEPPPGAVAAIGFHIDVAPVVVALTVSPQPPYHVIATVRDTAQSADLYGAVLTLWGVPADPSHDAERGGAGCLSDCPAGVAPKAFLTMPRACGAALQTTYAISSWDDPTHWVTGAASSPAMTGCDQLTSTPQASVQPTSTKQASPTGLDFSLDVDDPGLTDPNGVAQSDLKKAVVTLPAGLVVNPSSAAGLQGCTPAQLALETADSDPGAGCPEASKVASVSVMTPLLAEKLTGSLFLATPHDNPFDSLLAGYLVIRNADRGIIVKLPGKIDADPDTGRLTASFDQNPQIPFSHFEVKFPQSDRASLATSRACGPQSISAALDSWAGQSLTRTSDFTISGDGNGSACAPPQFAPSVSGLLTDPTAGGSSSFVLRIQRGALDNELKGITTQMPPGLLASVRGIPRCAEADAAAGTCPAESQIGRVETGAGVGPDPFFITSGRAYLTDGYNGAPFGLLIQVPAVAGPFDLGLVNIRAALQIDATDAHVTAIADPAPRILQGIPLQVRDVRVVLDRPGFMRAPTSCDEMTVASQISSWQGDTATPSSRFQVGGCDQLPYAPQIALTLTDKTQTRDGQHPGVTAIATQEPGEAAMRKVKVALPLDLALDPANAQALCEYDAGLKLDCPASSIVGHVTATTPLLNEPLQGPVYFVKNVRFNKEGQPIRTLPSLLVMLKGENGVALNLRATSDVDSKARLVTTFDMIPDAPVSSFRLDIDGGKHGIVVVTGGKDICRSIGSAIAETDAQSGKTHDFSYPIATPCPPKAVPGKAKSLKHGKVSLPVTLPNAGVLKAGGGKSGLKLVTKRVAKAGKVVLLLKPTAKTLKALRKRRSLKVSVPVSFQTKGEARPDLRSVAATLRR